MAVYAYGEQFGQDGHGESIAAARTAHAQNSAALLNLAEGKKVTAIRPAYDPNHEDNQWPSMLHHPEKGELQVGRNLKGVEDERLRKQILRDNDAAWDAAIKAGYREEPYTKPQVEVLSPEQEKANLLKTNAELQGKLIAQGDAIAKMQERMDALAAK